MNADSLRQLVADGLPALHAGGRIAAESIRDIQNDATHPDLKAALADGEQTSKEWQARLERAVAEVGASTDGDNPIIRAHGDVAAKIRAEAADDASRDLGIIASGQLALHYWIAAFGTLATYAERAGLDQTAQEMSRSADVAGEADKGHTALAAQILAA